MKIFIISCFFFITGCSPYMKCEERVEFKEERKWDAKNGLVKSPTVSWTGKWERL